MQKKASNITKKLLLSASIPLAASASIFAISCNKTFNKINKETLLSGKLQSKLSVLEYKWDSIEDRNFKSNHETKYRSLMKIARDAIASNKENEIKEATALIDDFIRELFFTSEDKIDIKDYWRDVNLYWESYERFIDLMQNQYISDAYTKVKQKYEKQSLRYKDKDYNIYSDGSKLVNILSKEDKNQVKVFALTLKNKVDAFEKELKDIIDTSTYNNAPKLDELVPEEIHIDWNYDVIPKLKELVNKTWDTETANKIKTGQTYGEVIKILGQDLSKHFNEIPKEYVDYWGSDILNPNFLKNEVLQLQDKKLSDKVEISKDSNFNVRAFNSDIISLSHSLAGFSAEEAIKYLFNNYVLPKITPFHSKIVVNNKLKKLIKEYENRFPNLKDKEYVFDDFDLTIPIGFSTNRDGTLKVRIKTFISVLSNDYTSSTVSLYGKINIKYPEKSEWDPETMASPTHYIDKYGNARFSYKRDFWDDEYNNINKIIKIGYFYINSKEVHTNGYSYPFNSKTIKIPLIQSPTMPRHINKVPELPEVITSIANMFYNNKSPNINGIEDWDTSNVVVMSSTFELSNFNQNISNWDTSNVDYMDRMFSWAKVFNQDISGWDVWKVKSMVQMFWAASSFNQPLNNWDVSQVTYMSCMFWGASSFNQPLDDWNVSKVKNMDHMFHNAVNFNQPLNSWNTKNVQDMNSMFFAAKRFNQPLNKWDVSNVENMKNMFNRATSFNQPLDRWKPKSLETMESMFWGASSFNQDLSSWHLAKNAARDYFNWYTNKWQSSKWPKFDLE